MRRHLIAATLAATALAGAAGGAQAASSTTRLSARLSGSAEVPSASKKASGSVTVTIRGGRVCWSFSRLRGIDTPTQAAVEKGARGETGGVVVPFGVTYRRRGCTVTTAAQAHQLALSPYGFYVNVHTIKRPFGALRGQLGK